MKTIELIKSLLKAFIWIALPLVFSIGVSLLLFASVAFVMSLEYGDFQYWLAQTADFKFSYVLFYIIGLGVMVVKYFDKK